MGNNPTAFDIHNDIFGRDLAFRRAHTSSEIPHESMAVMVLVA